MCYYKERGEFDYLAFKEKNTSIWAVLLWFFLPLAGILICWIIVFSCICWYCCPRPRTAADPAGRKHNGGYQVRDDGETLHVAVSAWTWKHDTVTLTVSGLRLSCLSLLRVYCVSAGGGERGRGQWGPRPRQQLQGAAGSRGGGRRHSGVGATIPAVGSRTSAWDGPPVKTHRTPLVDTSKYIHAEEQ